MPSRHRQILRFFSFRRIAIPVIIGFAAAAFLFVRDFDREVFANVQWARYPMLWFFLILVLMAMRHLAYMYRIRLLTEGELGWKKSFQVILLWEFSSAVTPTVVGGSAVALFVVKKEGISMGRTTAIVFATTLLDQMFFILVVPLLIIIAGTSNLFVPEPSFTLAGARLDSKEVFITGYLIFILLAALIFYGIFIDPPGVKKLLIRVFDTRLLRRWLPQATQTGDELIITSAEMKAKPFLFWLKASLATMVAWTARFWLVNILILTFTPVGDHFLILARQLIMWVILLVSPTPGGSGIAEYFFPIFLGEFMPPGLSTPLAIMWRLISCYPYIFLGVLILPMWIRRVYFGMRRNIRFRKP